MNERGGERGREREGAGEKGPTAAEYQVKPFIVELVTRIDTSLSHFDDYALLIL